MITARFCRKYPTLSLVIRILTYLNGLLLILWSSQRWFHGDVVASLSLFTVFSFSFELLWAHRMRGARLAWYVTCVAGLGMCGLFLANEGVRIQQQNTIQRAMR